MSKKALITGITGQDGSYLANFLLEKGYGIYGTYRRLSTPNFWRLESLNIFDKINLIPADLLDATSIFEAIEIAEPDEIYNLAAQSFVSASFEQPIGTGEITGLGTMRILEAIRHINPKIKFYQASTSELYGKGNKIPQNEDVPFHPSSPYAAAKLYSHWVSKIYRDGYNIFACNGILFNHESPLRGLEFVTRKISNAVAKIALGIENVLKLGNLEAKRDWGYAPQYVESMWLMLQQDEPDDFVISTGDLHSIKDLCEAAYSHVNLDWKDYVFVDQRFVRPTETGPLVGDYTKAKEVLKWKPKTSFEELIALMVDTNIARLK